MRELIQLVSTAGTGSTYVTSRTREQTRAKLQLRKFDKRAGKHVLFIEKKLPNPKG
jgi:large subunit ribosomal protein L33